MSPRCSSKPNERWGRVDVLVHNALIPYDVTSFADLSWEQLGGKLDRELHAAYSGDQSRCAGDDFPRLRPADLSHHGVVPPAPATA